MAEQLASVFSLSPPMFKHWPELRADVEERWRYAFEQVGGDVSTMTVTEPYFVEEHMSLEGELIEEHWEIAAVCDA